MPWTSPSSAAFFSSLKKSGSRSRSTRIECWRSADVADYIDRFYNQTRRHSHLGGVSPEQFEAAHKRR